MGQIVQLMPHSNMTVVECLDLCARTARDGSEPLTDVIVVSVSADDGRVMLRSSHISREFAVFILLEALDQARGK